MRIIVLNGSPKGEVSVTMQYVEYLRRRFPEHAWQIENVARDVGKLERDEEAFSRIMEDVRSSDIVVWAFPLYVFLVPAQYKRFIELVFERRAHDAFSGRYAASLSTSIHFFDQTAHAYLHAVCDDLGMRYAGFYSAEMRDLLKEGERERLEKFARLLFTLAGERVPVPRENPPLARPALSYDPGAPPEPVGIDRRRVVIVTDSVEPSGNLGRMIDRLNRSFAGAAELINLHDLDIRGGCLGCIRCGYDNTCVYADGYEEFYTRRLASADIIIMAGSVRDRYLSSKWKEFFDRSFFKGHIPGLAGRQIGFVISGPLGELPHLKEALSAWADNGGCHALFLTDEVGSSAELDLLLDAMARRLAACSAAGYIPPHTFYAVGGHKIFRDGIYGGMRIAFQADYRYYREHGLFDFPGRDLGVRAFNALFTPLTRIPAFRRRILSDLRHRMVRPFGPVLGSTGSRRSLER